MLVSSDLAAVADAGKPGVARQLVSFSCLPKRKKPKRKAPRCRFDPALPGALAAPAELVRAKDARPSDSPRRNPASPPNCSARHKGISKSDRPGFVNSLRPTNHQTRHALPLSEPPSNAGATGAFGEDCLSPRRSFARASSAAACRFEYRRAPRRGGSVGRPSLA